MFRGALDCGAVTFNTEMKVAASEALAALARKEAEPGLATAYKGQTLKFGPEYLIPKPFDSRLLATIAPAVAQAAQATGPLLRDALALLHEGGMLPRLAGGIGVPRARRLGAEDGPDAEAETGDGGDDDEVTGAGVHGWVPFLGLGLGLRLDFSLAMALRP